MEKKVLFAACVLLMSLCHAWADELTIGNVTVRQGETVDLTVNYSFTSTTDKVGFTFSAALPEGISFVKDEDGDPVYQKDATRIDKLNIVCVGEGNFAGQPATATATIKGNAGTLLTLTLKADASLAVGSSYDVNVTKVTFQERVDGSVKDINLDDFTFKVTIVEPADLRQCAPPTITYDHGRLLVDCESPAEAVCHVNVSSADAGEYSGNCIDLTPTYTITAWATAEGYADSQMATARLTWGDSGIKAENISITATKDLTADVNGDGIVNVGDIATIISDLTANTRQQTE